MGRRMELGCAHRDNDSAAGRLELHEPRPEEVAMVFGGVADALSFEDVFPYIMAVFALVEYLLMAVMVFGNLLILASYGIRKMSGSHRSQLSPSGRLVLNLAFADMLVGLGLCYFSIFKFWPTLAARLARYRLLCVLRFAVCFLTMFGSHCALLVVATDRYTAIVHTLHYKDYMTTRVSWCLVATGWAVPLAGAAAVFAVNQWRPDVPYCDEHHVVPNFLLAFALPTNVFVLVTIGFAHWRVHKEVKAYNRRCADPEFVARPASRPAVSEQPVSANPGTTRPSTATTSSRPTHRRGSRKSAHVLLQVTSTFILCWTPLDVMLALLIMANPRPLLLLLFECTFLLAMTSFLLNPFIYAWKTEATRRPLVSLLGRLGVLRGRGGQESRGDARGRGRRTVFTISGTRGSGSSSASATSASFDKTGNASSAVSAH